MKEVETLKLWQVKKSPRKPYSFLDKIVKKASKGCFRGGHRLGATTIMQ